MTNLSGMEKSVGSLMSTVEDAALTPVAIVEMIVLMALETSLVSMSVPERERPTPQCGGTDGINFPIYASGHTLSCDVFSGTADERVCVKLSMCEPIPSETVSAHERETGTRKTDAASITVIFFMVREPPWHLKYLILRSNKNKKKSKRNVLEY